jgi:hypothetical protein
MFTNLRRIFVLLLILAVGALIGTMLVGTVSAGQPGPPGGLEVAEQNLDSGGHIAVHEQGTADVNITNEAALSVTGSVTSQQGGAWSVDATQSGLWTVSVDDTSPIEVLDLASLKEPFLVEGGCFPVTDNVGAGACDVITGPTSSPVGFLIQAPEDQWLVVTQLSVHSTFFDLGRKVQVFVASALHERVFQPVATGISNPVGSTETGYYAGSWNTEMYIPPGQVVRVNISWAPQITEEGRSWRVIAEGYAITAPSG